MAKVQAIPLYPTLDEVDKTMERVQPREPERGYLGMSAIGHVCDRKLWYDFHFANFPVFDAATLRKFEDGDRSEDIMANRLKMVDGIHLDTHNKDGSQHGFKDLGGHFAGHMDGVIRGIAEAPRTWHVWEHKCSDRVIKNKLEKAISIEGEKNALKKWNTTYYAQAILYMYYAKLNRHYLTVCCSGSRSHISVRTEGDKDYAQELVARAKRIIASDRPLDRVSANPDYFVCEHMCDHSVLCHSHSAPQATCRSCIHSSPVIDDSDDAKWHCGFHNESLSMARQIAGCQYHCVRPEFISSWADVVDADEGENCVEYRNKLNNCLFTNGPLDGQYLSTELHAAENPIVIGDPDIDRVKDYFGGRLIDE